MAMIEIQDHKITNPTGAKLSKEALAVVNEIELVRQIMRGIINDKCTNPLEDEVFDRISNSCSLQKIQFEVTAPTAHTIYKLQYTPKVKETYRFDIFEYNIRGRIKRAIAGTLRDSYPYCFKKGRLMYFGVDVDGHVEKKRNQAKQASIKRKNAIPHSKKLQEELRKENLKKITNTVWEFYTDYSVIRLMSMPMTKHLKANFNVDGGKPLDEKELVTSCYQFILNSIELRGYTVTHGELTITKKEK